jgi:hypothetical protein
MPVRSARPRGHEGLKGGENLGDEESSEEEKEVTRLDSSAGSKATCSRRCSHVSLRPAIHTYPLGDKRAQSW